MNYTELARMTTRLSLDCDGARLDNVIDSYQVLCLSFTRYLADDAAFAPRYVLFDFAPAHLDLYPVTKPFKAPATPQAFTMLLRKYLVSQRLASMRLACDDRVVFLEFGPLEAPRHALVFEFTGRRSNVFLVALDSNEILGAVHKDDIRTVHAPYQRVPNSRPLDETSADRFAAIPNESYFDKLESYFSSRNSQETFKLAQDALQKNLKQAALRYDKRIQALYRDLEKTDLCKKDRYEADLLAAYAFKIPDGAAQVSLPDFETGQDVLIALAPDESVRQNIERRYNRCKRASRAIPQIEARLDEATLCLEKLHAAQTRLTESKSLLEISQIEKSCADAINSVLPKKQNSAKKSPVEPHKPYKTFSSASGIPILVGKSADDNDFLTFRVARGNDWWFHVAHMPGSHVVLRSPTPDSDAILDAAMLAVHYSKLAQAQHAEVHAVQQKYVHRIKGAPAGKVEIRGERVIYVDIQDARLKRLLKTEQ